MFHTSSFRHISLPDFPAQGESPRHRLEAFFSELRRVFGQRLAERFSEQTRSRAENEWSREELSREHLIRATMPLVRQERDEQSEQLRTIKDEPIVSEPIDMTGVELKDVDDDDIKGNDDRR